MRQLLKEIREHGIFIALEGDNLKLKFNQTDIHKPLLEKIKSNKAALIEHLRAYTAANTDEVLIPKAPPSDEGYVLSSAQMRLWILGQFQEGLAAYNITNQIKLNGDYDIGIFKQAISAVIDRHEILRTVFKKNTQGEVRQYVLESDALGFVIDHVDLRGAKGQHTALNVYIQKDTYQTFDLEKGPLLRAALLQIEADTYVFHYNMHHIIGDAWSMGVLARDVMAYYKALKSTGKPSITSLALQYKDYAVWQQGVLKSTPFERHRNYWLNALSGELPLIDLPSRHPRPPVKTQNGQKLQTYLSKALVEKLKAFSQQHGGSLFMTLLGLWNVLLYRYTSQEDLVIGSPVAGRENMDLENQIGFYINTIVLRNKVAPAQSFVQHYESVKANTLSAFSHQSYPFDQLLEELELSRDVSRSALFDIMVVLQNTGETVEGLNIKGNPEAISDRGKCMTKFDLQVDFWEVGGMLSMSVELNTDVYEVAMVKGFMAHFKGLANAAMSQPDVAVSELNYMPESEKYQLITAFNNTGVTYPQEHTIISLFEEQVEKYPDKTAISGEGTSYTYKQLDRITNQMAWYLIQKHGLKPNEMAGILLERSPWVVVAILGVLKAGSAYVPMSTDYPEERIGHILTDSNCKVCIDAEVLCQFMDQRDSLSDTSPNVPIGPTSLAYVIFTSGTTGVPKGTLINHKNVVRLFFNDAPLFDFGVDDVWCLFHSYCFDFSVWEIFGALLFGGRLAVVSSEVAKDTGAFCRFLKDEAVTILNQTPTSFMHLQEKVLQLDSPIKVRYLIFGGERLSPDVLKNWKAAYPTCRAINMYGITETTVHVTYKEITEKETNTTVSNIGVPLPTLGCLVMDHALQIVPANVTGELYVYGEGLAEGYLNRDSLTDDRFFEIDIMGLGKTRVYKSGDLAQWGHDGDLIYMGRADNQVKIRGHRIELGEVTHYLSSKEDIKEAVVVARKLNQTDNELVAYTISEKEQDASSLRSFLNDKIPYYAIPAYFVQVATFPLTINGKIDLKALPDPRVEALKSGQAYVGPSNEIEEKLIQIFANVLGSPVETLGVNDNFFDLGANSIKLVKVLDGIKNEFNVELRAVSLFQYVTVSELAANVFQTNDTCSLEEEDNLSDDLEDIMDLMEE